MKNLLIYVNPRKDWDDETRKLIKLQVDNSLDLGWSSRDIILATNFPYFLMDTTKEEDMKRLIETIGSDIDLVVDDGPHDSNSQINTARMLLPLLDKAIYIIEDVKSTHRVMHHLAHYKPELYALTPVNLRTNGRPSRDNNFIVIRK